jgi:hypothetical protein
VRTDSRLFEKVGNLAVMVGIDLLNDIKNNLERVVDFFDDFRLQLSSN